MKEIPVHLANAARTLERILNARDPDHVYTVSVESAHKSAGEKWPSARQGGER